MAPADGLRKKTAGASLRCGTGAVARSTTADSGGTVTVSRPSPSACTFAPEAEG